MKWLGLILLAAVMNGWGFQQAKRYKQRLLFWRQAKHMADQFATEIRYTADSPDKILTRLLAQPEFAHWRCTAEEETFHLRFARMVQAAARRVDLPPEEQGELDAFGRGLGTTDLEGQLAHCAAFSRRFEQRIRRAEETDRTKGRLCRSLWLLASAAVTILLL